MIDVLIRRLRSICLLALMLTASSALAQQALPEWVIRDVNKIMESADDDPQAAIDAFAGLLNRRRHSGHVQAYISQQRAALQIREQQVEGARDTLLAVVTSQDGEYVLPLRLMLGQAYLMLDDYKAGLEQLEAWASAVDSPDPSGLFLLGYGYLRVDDLTSAIERLEQAMALSEETPRNHWIELLAYAYARADRPQDALALMRELLARNPAQERWWRQLASVLLLMDDIQRGTAALSIATVIEPGTYEQRRRLARFLAHVGMPLDGAETLLAAMQEYPEAAAPDDQLLLAEMWLLARDTDAALPALQEAQALMPDDGKASMILGQVHLHWERYEQARDALQLAVNAYGEETPAEVYYLLAICHINLKQHQAARRALVFLDGDAEYANKAAQLSRFITSREAADS